MIPHNVACAAYAQLRDTVDWQEGVRSRKGFTRLARGFLPGENSTVDELICLTLHNLHIYVNYYKDGEHWTPNHTHPGTKQIIISLRTVCGRSLRLQRAGSRSHC